MVQGRLALRLFSGALHARMHFEQGVLDRLGTDRPLRARQLLELPRITEIGNIGWVRAAHACP